MTEQQNDSSELLSVIVPVFNEAITIREILRRVARVPIPKEIIVVDDGSSDGTREILRTIESSPEQLFEHSHAPCSIRVLLQDRNQGKGAAIRTGINAVTGKFVIIQDADLEYDPAEYPKLLQPILDGKAEVVYGSRFAGDPRRVLFFWHTVGNKFLTLVSNMFTNLNLTDMETGFKMFLTDVLKKIALKSDRFGFEPEVTAKLARQGAKIYEVSISYSGRTYAEGKKINWKDGVSALWAIVRYNLFDDTRDAGEKTLRRLSHLSRYNAWIVQQFSRFAGQRILEVGAGIGNITRFFLDRDLIIATEIQPQYLRRLRNTFTNCPNVVVGSLDVNDSPPEWVAAHQVNTVVCLNVLEHIEDDERVLRNFFDLLPAGGRTVLVVPALSSLYGAIDKAIGHYRRYNKEDIQQKLERAGFKVEETRFFNMLGTLGWFLNSRLLKRTAVPGIQARLNDWLVPVLRLEKYFPIPLGMSLLVVGKKT